MPENLPEDFPEAVNARARLFVPDGLSPGASIRPAAAQAHYLLDVMRCRVGDAVSLFNGRDGEWLASVASAARRSCVLELREQTRRQPEERGPVLLFAPLKRARQELVAEKATELGVSALVPVRTRRGVVDRINKERLAAITIEAAEQCGRLTLPRIEELRPLETCLANWPESGRIYAGDETGGGEPLIQALERHGDGAVLIGPEGGFHPDELLMLRRHPAVVPVDLGPRILRAETAAITALAIWQAVLGRRSGAG